MQNALTDFQTSLNRVRNLANDASANTSAALADPALRERHDTALSAVVVTLSGFFESFLRQTAEEYADQIDQQNHLFSQLKPAIRHAHFQGGGQLLTAIGGKNRSTRHNWTTADALDVVQRLASVHAGTGYELVWEAFAETRGNPGPEVVKEFLVRFGVEKPMETLSQHMGQSITLTLGSFIDVRNECAHNGQPNQTPQPSDVLDYCELLERTARGIVDTLAVHQVNQVPPVPASAAAVPAVPSSTVAAHVATPTAAARFTMDFKKLWEKFIAILRRI
jgi:hypothetical protein